MALFKINNKFKVTDIVFKLLENKRGKLSEKYARYKILQITNFKLICS